MKTLFNELETGEPEYVDPVLVFDQTEKPTTEKKNDNTLLIVLIIAIVAIAVLYYLKNRNDGNTGNNTNA